MSHQLRQYVVVLQIVRRGAVIGSTEDVISAACAADAEQQAIEAWKLARPGCTFQPLVTVEQ